MPLRSGLEKDLGDAGSVISGGTGDADSSASGMELREASGRGRAEACLPGLVPSAAACCGAPAEEECEAVEAAEGGVEGEGVENRRREGEESTAKSGSVSLVRSRSSIRRLAIDEEEEEEAEEE